MRYANRAGAVGLAVFVAVTGTIAQSVTVNLDSDAPGTAPRGFIFAAARQSTPGTWEVRGMASHHYLAHAADPSARGMALAIVAALAPRDLALTARIRFADGDRLGGLVWRYQDDANFYFVGINLQRHEAVLHRIMAGNRVLLDTSKDLNIDPVLWHNVAVVHRNDQIVIHLNGIAILHARDRGFDNGRAGVFSAGSAETWFADIKLEEMWEGRR
jgi:hypothetical protein